MKTIMQIKWNQYKTLKQIVILQFLASYKIDFFQAWPFKKYIH